MPTTVITLYRLFNRQGRLLYVGVTGNLTQRLATHASRKAWWSEVDQNKTTTQDHPDRNSATTAESLAIVAESPVYNKAGKPGNIHERVGANAGTMGAIAAARRRRFHRALGEMRDSGLAVEVLTADLVAHPDYTVAAVRQGLARQAARH